MTTASPASSTLATVDEYAGKTVLITGGRGYLGSALTQSLATTNCRIILVDWSPSESWMPDKRRAHVVHLERDVSIQETWDSVLPEVDYVFHFAGKDYVHRSEPDPLLDLRFNALPIIHLLSSCRLHGHRPKIVFPSSANLFGRTRSLPVDEQQRDDPLIPWAVHKLLAENYLRVFAENYRIGSVVLRLANVYGPTARWSVMDHVVINRIISKALAGEPLTVYANRNCVRDYVFLDDVVQALLLAGIQSDPTDSVLYVIGSGEGKTISDVWRLVADKAGLRIHKDVPIHFDASVKVEPLEMRDFVANISSFQLTSGWTPRIGLDQGIELTMDAIMDGHSRLHAYNGD